MIWALKQASCASTCLTVFNLYFNHNILFQTVAAKQEREGFVRSLFLACISGSVASFQISLAET